MKFIKIELGECFHFDVDNNISKDINPKQKIEKSSFLKEIINTLKQLDDHYCIVYYEYKNFYYYDIIYSDNYFDKINDSKLDKSKQEVFNHMYKKRIGD